MTAVFSHGRLRLYLLKLLAEGPKHGYELIRLLENRFLGLYAPSAGTIYPRLARMEAEGLVTHTQAGGRKVYQITGDGRAELTQRAGELAELETEIHASVADLTTLATEIEQHVSGSVRDLKRELRDATRQIRSGGRGPWPDGRPWGAGAHPGAPAGSGAPGGSGGPAASGAPDGSGAAAGSGAPDGSGGPAGSGAAGFGAAAGHGAAAGPSSAAPGAGPDDASGTNGPAAGDLERAVGQLASEVRRMARQAAVGDAQLRAATAVVSSALTELRRLLRG
ncbi:MAG TPA: PadR family transcriptional regulator [Rugosimonospora sp.]|jgi:DNA-binding PadR family transcriptional regulator